MKQMQVSVQPGQQAIVIADDDTQPLPFLSTDDIAVAHVRALETQLRLMDGLDLGSPAALAALLHLWESDGYGRLCDALTTALVTRDAEAVRAGAIAGDDLADPLARDDVFGVSLASEGA